jgi:hypothetical protein
MCNTRSIDLEEPPQPLVRDQKKTAPAEESEAEESDTISEDDEGSYIPDDMSEVLQGPEVESSATNQLAEERE